MKKIIIIILAFLLMSCRSGGGADGDSGVDVHTDGVSDASIDGSDAFISLDGTNPSDADVPDGLDGTADTLSADQAEDASATDVKTDSYQPTICPELKEGRNTDFVVDGIAREFILNLPSAVDTRDDWPVVFAWHGSGDTAQNFSNLLKPQVDNADFPFIGITPEDTNLSLIALPPEGLEWDIFNLTDGSIEARFVDEILTCLEKQFGIDESHVHSLGFSAGAITSDSIAVVRGDIIASMVTFSGAYFSNPADVEDLGTFYGIDISEWISWPEMTTSNKFTQILLYGGQSDTWGTGEFMVKFYNMAQNDTAYLNALGHDVILCNHESGHTVSGLTPDQVIRFFRDHPLGQFDSPYATLPQDFPSHCSFKPKSE
jgi:predicted esterase